MAFEVFVLCLMACTYTMFVVSLVQDAARKLMPNRDRAIADWVGHPDPRRNGAARAEEAIDAMLPRSG